jgi:hypothetical protein
MTEPDPTSFVIDARKARCPASGDPIRRGRRQAALQERHAEQDLLNRGSQARPEVDTSRDISNRAYWPPREEGQVWVAWVSHAFFYPNYRGSLPANFDFRMDDSASTVSPPNNI